MMRRDQARPVDPVQAVKVRLAIRWNVPLRDISDQRVKEVIAADLAERGEEVVAFQR